MRKEDKLKLELQGIMTPAMQASFQLLYTPLLGKAAAHLYSVLYSLGLQKAGIRNHRLILELTKSSVEQMERQRHLLEQYLLVKTFYHGAKNAYIYQIYLPKDGYEFLKHEVFGRLYLKEMGTQVYEFQKLTFAKAQENKEEYEEITLPFENILKDDWKDEQEEKFLKLRPEEQLSAVSIPLHFNFDRFLHGLSDMILPCKERSEKNLRLIGELATIYGISEEHMRKLVAQSLDLKTGQLQTEKLRAKAKASRTVYKSGQTNPYLLPPVRFLQQKQHGVEVTKADKNLIETLIYDYKMIPEVVNVLLEYVLDVTDQKLSKAYVEKIAGVWIRRNIDTYEKARRQVEEENSRVSNKYAVEKKELPDWYHDQKGDGTTDFDEQEFEKELRKLRGE